MYFKHTFILQMFINKFANNITNLNKFILILIQIDTLEEIAFLQ